MHVSVRPMAVALVALAWALGPAGAPPADAAEAPAGSAPLQLGALLREAEEHNPEIAAAQSRVRAADSAPSQAQVAPDPLVSVSYTNDTLSDLTLGESEFTVLTFAWTQELRYPGKLRLGGDVARREVEIWSRRADQIRLNVASGIKRAFADLYRIDRTWAILNDSRTLLVSFQDTARARYEAGEGILENVLKAQTEIIRLDAAIEGLARERDSVQASLNALAGQAAHRPLGPALELPAAVPLEDPASLEAEALSRSPEVLEVEATVRRDESRLELARREKKPDMMWGAAYQYRGDLDPMVMGMFGVRLPIHGDRKQAQGVVQAEHDLNATRSDVASARLKTAAEVADLVAQAARAATLSRLYAEGVIPQARSALESAAASYGVGRVDFLTLLADFTSLLTYEIEYETQRADQVATLASLERLTARTLLPVDLPDGVSDE